MNEIEENSPERSINGAVAKSYLKDEIKLYKKHCTVPNVYKAFSLARI